MKKILRVLPVLIFVFLCYISHAQLYKIELDEKINNSPLILEGKVIAKKSFWNDAHTMIFTTNTVEVYKSFKGNMTEGTIEIMTQGGSVGTDYIEVSHLLQLNLNEVGIFFCEPNRINLRSPITKKVLFDVYSSDQGFLRYDMEHDVAFAPFSEYENIESNLYNIIQQKTGQIFRVINTSFKVSVSSVSPFTGSLTSFSPTTVNGGTLNDPVNNTLTINGSGFGTTASGSSGVRFKSGDGSGSFTVPYTSDYFVSWSDTKIVIKVPPKAATGFIAVISSSGSAMESALPLTVFYSVLNAEFHLTSPVDTILHAEERLMNANGSGGYTFHYSTSTAGGGVNFATSPVRETFLRALATWKEAVGVNFIEGNTTTVQAITNEDNPINIIVFDNTNTGVPAMASGVLEVTYSYASGCFNTSPLKAFPAQKTGFDILLRNNGVSIGNIPFTDGPCFPDAGTYDREMIILHEIGHALDLAHINDDEEGNNAPNINPSKVMHYAIVNYVGRRSLDNSAYQGALYATTKQNNNYGGCADLLTSEMTLLSKTVIPNDNCPASFPVATTTPGTVVNFDLIHATSNKFADPQSNGVNCSNTITQVTNNAYTAIRTANTTNGTLAISISGYNTLPSSLTSCEGQGVKIAVYDVSVCPAGQSYPAPVACRTFTGNGPVADITGLQPNRNYLLYFDGVRNTKASFSATLNGSALPLTLSRFTGEYIKGMNQLYIDVLQAINVKAITIEKSGDGVRFNQIGTLSFTSSTLLGKHTYIDAQPFAGNNFYRLVIMDNDGSVDYSNIILLKNDEKRLVYVYPNPVKDVLNVNITATTAARYNCFIYDVSGRLLGSEVHQVSEGTQTIHIPFNRIASGAYIIKIADADKNIVIRQNIIKQ